MLWVVKLYLIFTGYSTIWLCAYHSTSYQFTFVVPFQSHKAGCTGYETLPRRFVRNWSWKADLWEIRNCKVYVLRGMVHATRLFHVICLSLWLYSTLQTIPYSPLLFCYSQPPDSSTQTFHVEPTAFSVFGYSAWNVIVQELCESRGGRPGLSVLTSLLVSVDVKLHWTMLRHWSQLVPNMSTDIWGD